MLITRKLCETNILRNNKDISLMKSKQNLFYYVHNKKIVQKYNCSCNWNVVWNEKKKSKSLKKKWKLERV